MESSRPESEPVILTPIDLFVKSLASFLVKMNWDEIRAKRTDAQHYSRVQEISETVLDYLDSDKVDISKLLKTFKTDFLIPVEKEDEELALDVCINVIDRLSEKIQNLKNEVRGTLPKITVCPHCGEKI